MLQSVTPSEDLFSITWNTGPRCNFECSYCPPRWHDKTSPAQSFDSLKKTWEELIARTSHRNKRYKLAFTGGEPTINPDFIEFLSWLKQDERIANIGFSTNGSSTKQRYLQAMRVCDWISFSSHTEFMNVKKFKDNVIATHISAIKQRKMIWVNIMDESFAHDEVRDIQIWCDRHKIPNSLQKIHWGDYYAQARQKSQL